MNKMTWFLTQNNLLKSTTLYRNSKQKTQYKDTPIYTKHGLFKQLNLSFVAQLNHHKNSVKILTPADINSEQNATIS